MKKTKNEPEVKSNHTAYKGFDLKLTDGMFTSRNNTTFKIGKWKTMRQSPRVGYRGFHSSPNPYNILSMRVAGKTRFTKVSCAGEESSDVDRSVTANSKLRVDRECSVCEFVQEAIRFRDEEKPYVSDAVQRQREQQVQEGSSEQAVLVSPVADSILWARKRNSVVVPLRGSSVGVTEDDYSVATAMGLSGYAATLGYASVAVASNMDSAAETRGNDSIAVALRANSRATTKGIDSVAVAQGENCKAECEAYHSVAVAWDQRSLVSVGKDSVGVVFAYVQESGDTISPFFKAGKRGRILIMIVNRHKNTLKHTVAIGGKDIEVDTYYRYGWGGIQRASLGEVSERGDYIELSESLVLEIKDMAKYSQETNDA
jgi:hypothetical protein